MSKRQRILREGGARGEEGTAAAVGQRALQRTGNLCHGCGKIPFEAPGNAELVQMHGTDPCPGNARLCWSSLFQNLPSAPSQELRPTWPMGLSFTRKRVQREDRRLLGAEANHVTSSTAGPSQLETWGKSPKPLPASVFCSVP